MAAGRIRRSARRGLTVAVLGWVGVAAASVLTAPPAAAASSYVVHIKDLTPPVASVDKNGTVRFIDEIPDKTVSVSVGPGGVLGGVTLVNVTAKTQVVLTLPSGDHPLEPTTDPAHPTSLTAWDEVFHDHLPDLQDHLPLRAVEWQLAHGRHQRRRDQQAPASCPPCRRRSW